MCGEHYVVTVADVRMQLPLSKSGAPHSGAGQVLTSPSRHSGPVAGNRPIVYSPSKSVGYLNEYVRFMQTNKSGAQYKRREHLRTGENNGNLADGLQETTSNGNSGQSETFKMEVVGKNSAVEFSGHVAKGTCASNQDSAVKSLGKSQTLSSLSSIQKSAVAAKYLDSDSIVEMKHHMVKTDKIKNEETECEQVVKMKIGSRENEAGGIKTEKIEAEMMGDEKIGTERVSVSVTSTVAALVTTPTFVSGVGCEEFNKMRIATTGLASVSGLSEIESHKKVINAVGGLLELKKQGVSTSAVIEDASSHSLQEAMAALHKYTEVSVTPISSLQKPKPSHDVKLDTGQTSTQLSDSKVSNSPAMPSASMNSTIYGRTCSIFEAEIPCMSSKIEKSKSEPKPQTQFRIRINRKNEMYLCNTETGEIKPLHTVKSAKKSCWPNSRATPVLDQPSNVPSNSKSMSLEPPLHSVRVAGSEQSIIPETTNTGVKSEQCQQVTKTALVKVSVSGMSGTPSHIPKPSSSQLVSIPGSATFSEKPVISSISKLSHSELMVKPSQVSKPSMLVTPPHVPKIVITRKPTATLPLSSKGQSPATVTANQKPNRRKPKYVMHNAHGKMSRHTIELQEALESCVESMLATDRDDNSVTLFGPGDTSDTVVKADKSLPGLLEGISPTSDVTNIKDIPQKAQPDKHWPSLGHEVTVETTTDATPPLLEASPPLLEPASSHQLTSSGEEGSSQPPQLTPESNTSIRTASTAHTNAKNRKCKFC
jgi:hypothetical protein